MRFSGRTAVVTGAANGIGREYAEAFAGEGAELVLIDTNASGLAETEARIGAGGGKAIAVCADVTNEVAIREAIEQGVDRFGGVDVLVNNAGLHLGRYNETSTLPAEEWRRILDVNVVGQVICAAACRPYLKASGTGVIINQSSTASYVSGGGAYGVSKLALNGLTMSLAAEFAPDKIRVLGIAPGMVGSPAVLNRLEEHHKELVLRTQMIKRFGEMSDLASVVLFLCSDEASFMTAQTIVVDGGFIPMP